MDKRDYLIPQQVVEGYGGRNVAHKKFVKEGRDYLLRVAYEEEK